MTDDRKSPRANRIVSQNTRPTIGLLIGETTELVSWDVWKGVNDVTQAQDVNLISFVGGALRPPHGFVAQANVLYDLVNPETLDGLVILGGTLAQYVAPEEIMALCQRYRPLPVVSVSLLLRDIPSVLVSNYLGVRDVMAHLVEVHGYRRIAFIRGPKGHPGAEDRYRAYRDVLAECGISLDPALVAPGEFSELSGSDAIALWLDEQKLRPQVDIEAVVAVDDDTAFGALEALLARGIRVPGDVAIAGFDNVADAKSVMPPLTTVRQSTYEMGRQAAKTLLAMLAGEQAPAQVTIPTKLMVRRSCGCLSPTVSQAAAGPMVGTGEPFKAAFAARRKEIAKTIRTTWVSKPIAASAPVERLLDALPAELTGEYPGVFLATVDEILHHVVMEDEAIVSWQKVLSAMRHCTLPCLVDEPDRAILFRAQDLWLQVQAMVGEAIQQSQIHGSLRAERWATLLRQVGYELTSTFSMTELVNELTYGLSQTGIPSCYLSLYELDDGQTAPSEMAQAILVYENNEQTDLAADERRFPSRRLAPQGMLAHEERYSMLVLSLYSRTDQFGFVLFEAGPREGMVYDTLRGQLVGALRGVRFLQEREQAAEMLEKAYAEVEKQVEERTIELQREIVARERAQAESLQLQQEVIKAQELTIQKLLTPIIPIVKTEHGSIIVMPLVGSIDSMRAREITRALLAGIGNHQAQVVILDITGVSVVDSGVANHLNKTIRAAHLKGARTIVTGISEEIAETIVDLGIDWTGIETLNDLQSGLLAALDSLGFELAQRRS